MTRLLCQLDLTHIRCDARAHNRSIATAHQPRRPLFAPYASATSTDPTETLPKASPDTAPPLRTRRHNTRWSHSQIGSMELEGVPGLTERSHGHRATRTWVSLYHRADVEEVATATCGTLDARSLRAWHQRGEAAQAWRSARGATGSTSGAGDWQWCTGTHISTHDFSTHEFLRFTLLLWILSYWIMFTVRTDHVPTDHAATVCPTPSVQQHAPSARLASPLPPSARSPHTAVDPSASPHNLDADTLARPPYDRGLAGQAYNTLLAALPRMASRTRKHPALRRSCSMRRGREWRGCGRRGRGRRVSAGAVSDLPGGKRVLL